MRVLVIGATGFVGFPVAQALARAGYQVYGLARTDAKAKVLAQNEIIPVIGDAVDTKSWTHLVPTLDVVIEAAGGSDAVSVQDAVFHAVRTAATSRPAGSAKISYIYTSGTWIHGDNRNTGQVVTDTTPLTSPAEIVAWRPAKETRVLQDDVLNGIVIRPALLYGKGGSIFDPYFKGAGEGKVRWPGPAGGRLSLVHCDDLADLYVRVSERAQVLGGRAFDAANDISESVDDVLVQLVRVSGAKGPAELYEPTNVFEKAITTTSLLRPYLARSLVGWQPRKQGLADGMELYYAAWQSLKA